MALAAGMCCLWSPARAELIEVRQVAGGMECPECARGLRLVIRKLPGVDDAETSWNRRVLTVRLRPGNPATLAQIRTALSRQHFQALEAEVVMAGRLVVEPGGDASLSISETRVSYRIDLTGAAATWRRTIAALSGHDVVLRGRVPGGRGADDPLLIFPLDLRDRAPSTSGPAPVTGRAISGPVRQASSAAP